MKSIRIYFAASGVVVKFMFDVSRNRSEAVPELFILRFDMIHGVIEWKRGAFSAMFICDQNEWINKHNKEMNFNW